MEFHITNSLITTLEAFCNSSKLILLLETDYIRTIAVTTVSNKYGDHAVLHFETIPRRDVNVNLTHSRKFIGTRRGDRPVEIREDSRWTVSTSTMP